MTHLLAFFLVVGMAVQQGAAPRFEMESPVSLPFAGVKVALPKGFQLQRRTDASAVFRAVKLENNQPVMAVLLSAFPLPARTTLLGFVSEAKPKPTLVLRNLRHIRSAPVKVAGRKAEIRIVSYEYRGVETTALLLFVLRPVESASMQMGYRLIVEGEKKRGKQILSLLGAVGDSLEFCDPVRPVTQEITALDEPVVSKKWGYSIRPPRWWKAVPNREHDMIMIFQTDYLRGGTPMPQVTLVVKPEAGSAKASARMTLKNLQEELTRKKREFKVVREGPARMAGRDGYEFVVRQEMPAPTTQKARPAPAGSLFIGERTVCAGGKSYSLLVFYETRNAEDVTAAMEAVVSGVELFPAATTAPASPAGTGTTTAPAPPIGPTTGPRGRIVPQYEE